MTGEPMWWGVTMSSLQAEGVAPSADWSRWEREKRVPLSGDGNGLGTNHHDDFELLASLGLTHVRLTLEWARLEPAPGRLDATAFDLYEDVLVSARRAGLGVVATLHHTTLPGWFADDTHGFRDERQRDLTWARHVDRCAERYDHLVAAWVPVDDPIGWAVRGHLLGSRPPGRRDPEMAMAAVEGAMLAAHRAWTLLSSGTTPVMGVFGVPTIFGVGPDADQQQRWWHELLVDTWIGAVRDGELRVPHRTPRSMPEMADAFDLIGVVHDHPIGVTRTGAIVPYPEDGRRSDTGFTPVANELGELLSYLSTELPNRPLVVAGHGVATADDEWREELVRDTVHLVRDLRADGVPLRGYFHDTGIDGYEGPYGFTTGRGLIGRDRVVRESGEWLRRTLTGAAAAG